MKMLVYLSSIILVGGILVGCSNNEYTQVKNENQKLKKNLIALEEKLEQNKNTIEKLGEEIQKYKDFHESKSEPSFFDVNTERILFISKTLVKDDLTIEKVKKQLGEPVKIETYEGVSGKYTVLKYKGIEFTFFKQIKWLKITNPNFMTNRGITVGSSKDEVLNGYSREYEGFLEEGQMLVYGEKAGITFKMENDRVKEIFIRYEYE